MLAIAAWDDIAKATGTGKYKRRGRMRRPFGPRALLVYLPKALLNSPREDGGARITSVTLLPSAMTFRNT